MSACRFPLTAAAFESNNKQHRFKSFTVPSPLFSIYSSHADSHFPFFFKMKSDRKAFSPQGLYTGWRHDYIYCSREA
jgi:hypothetical protein